MTKKFQDGRLSYVYFPHIFILGNKSLSRLFWEEDRPSSTEDESETEYFSLPESEAETMSSCQVGENLLIETLEDEVQNLQLLNIELKTKYKAAKTELKRNTSRRLEKLKIETEKIENRNEKIKLEKDLMAANTRIEKLENDLKCQKIWFDKLKSEYEDIIKDFLNE